MNYYISMELIGLLGTQVEIVTIIFWMKLIQVFINLGLFVVG